MKELRVLQIIDSLNVGGAEVMAINISNGLGNLGIKSHICSTREQGELLGGIDKNVGYLFLNKKSIIDIKAVLKLRRYVKKNKINVIHAHSSSYFLAILLKITLPRLKLIWHDHFGNSEFLSERKSLMIKIGSLFFHAIISVNQNLKTWASQNLYCSKVIFINNFSVFNNLTNTTILKGENDKRIVCLAGFREQKDHLNLLRAFSEILKYHNWSLHLIGKDYDDNYSKEIKTYIEENKLSNRVFLYGVCLDVKNILNQSSIGVLSSKSEGLPVSLLEYGLAKLPVVVTNVGECSKLFKINNYVVPPENWNLLFKAMRNLIENEKERNILASALHKEVLFNYSEQSVIKKILEIYKLK